MGLHPMSAVSPKPGSGGAVSAAAALGSKARKAAEQFEAVLLQSLLEPPGKILFYPPRQRRPFGG